MHNNHETWATQGKEQHCTIDATTTQRTCVGKAKNRIRMTWMRWNYETLRNDYN